MVLSREEKHKAYEEAQSILALGKKWQQLVPGEKRPNFEQAAAMVLRRALGHKTSSNRANMDIHNGLMAQHKPAEARLIERTLQSGMFHPDVLHSFRDDRRTNRVRPVKPAPIRKAKSDPDVEVWVQHQEDMDHASHYNVNSGEFASNVVDMHVDQPRRVQMAKQDHEA